MKKRTISNGSELPITIFETPYTAIEEHDDEERWTEIIASRGRLPYGLHYARQFFEDRTRNLAIIDTQNSSRYVINGYGFGTVDYNTTSLTPTRYAYSPALPIKLDEYDNSVSTFKGGTLSYDKKGRVVITRPTDLLGAISRPVLNTKIKNTSKAQRILDGVAIVPQWVANGTYELDDQDTELGWGVYKLPAASLSLPHLAELQRLRKEEGMESDIYEEMTFKFFKALRTYHAANWVHLQPHPGNIFASFDEKGTLLPVLTDFGTAQNISSYSNKKLGIDGIATPKQLNYLQDFMFALEKFIQTMLNFGLGESGFQFPEQRLYSEVEFTQILEKEQEIIKIINAAVLGYASTHNTSYSSGLMKRYLEMFDIMNEEGGMMNDGLKEGDIAKAISTISEMVIKGVHPGIEGDEEDHEFMEYLKALADSSYKRKPCKALNKKSYFK